MSLFEAISLLLNDKQQEEAQQCFADYQKLDANAFIKKYKWLLRYWDKEDHIECHDELSANVIFVYYLSEIKFVMNLDWSGEEYPGQIKKFLHARLKQYGYTNIKLTDKMEKEKIKNNQVSRGTWIPLLLNCFDKQLAQRRLKIANISFGHDEYNIAIVPIDWFMKMDGFIDDEYCGISDTSVWELHIMQIGEKRSATMSLLRTEFSIPLTEINDFISKLPIHLGTGSKRRLLKLKDKYEQVGCIMQLRKYDE